MNYDDQKTAATLLGVLVGLIVFGWQVSILFHLIPIEGYFQWWHLPWMLTAVVCSFVIGFGVGGVVAIVVEEW